MDIDVTKKKNILKGMLVDIVDESNGKKEEVVRGYVVQFISKENNKKGIKVQLSNGKSGRVINIPSKDDVKRANFTFYNVFFFLPKIYSIWDKENKKYLVIAHINGNSHAKEETAILFDEKEKAQLFIKGTKYESKEYMVKELNRNKRIHENFKTLKIDYFRINGTRKLSKERLMEWEDYFKNMR